jgi:hypothetical protein
MGDPAAVRRTDAQFGWIFKSNGSAYCRRERLVIFNLATRCHPLQQCRRATRVERVPRRGRLTWLDGTQLMNPWVYKRTHRPTPGSAERREEEFKVWGRCLAPSLIRCRFAKESSRTSLTVARTRLEDEATRAGTAASG